MKRFLRFRLSSHALPIEAGRHTKPHTPRSARLCTHCSDNVVGDEKHFVFECAFLQPLRLRYDYLFVPPITSMRCFFSQKHRMSVFKFILDCLDMMNI